MDSFYYWLIAWGIACIGINITVGGVELLLPTCVGYALIGIGAWNLRDEDAIFHYAPSVAGLMAILSFPDLFSDAMVTRPGQPHPLQQFHAWTFYPYTIISMALLASIAVAIARQARKQGRIEVDRLAMIAAVAVIVCEIPRFFMPFPSQSWYIAFFFVTSFYAVLLFWTAAWAARRLA